MALNHAKKFIRSPDKDRVRQLLSYSRSQLKTIVEAITGHCSLKKHMHTMGKVSEPDCRKCGLEDETAFHILCDCPTIMSLRVRIYGRHILLPDDVMKEPLWKIAKLITEARLA